MCLYSGTQHSGGRYRLSSPRPLALMEVLLLADHSLKLEVVCALMEVLN